MIQDAARSPTDVVMRREVLEVRREADPIADDNTRTREGTWVRWAGPRHVQADCSP